MSRRLNDEAGFTLVELLISASLMMVILLATLSVLDGFQSQSARATVRLDSRDRVRNTLDRLAKRVRTAVAAPNDMVEVASPTDLVYQVVGGTAPSSTDTNRTGAQRVRYCLDTTSNKIYRQSTSWTGAAPALPSQPQSCPSSAYSATPTVWAQNVSNGARPLFTYDFRPGSTALTDLTGVTISLFIDANGPRPPAEAGMTTSIALRNVNQPPTADFTFAVVNGHILANASPSLDPEGSSLGYAWFVDGSTTSSSGDVRLDVGGVLNNTVHSVTLTVTDSGGLTDTKTLCVPVAPTTTADCP